MMAVEQGQTGGPAPHLLVLHQQRKQKQSQRKRKKHRRCCSACALSLLLPLRLTFPMVLASMVGTSRSPMWADHSLAVATRVSLSHPHVRRLPLLKTEWGGEREGQESEGHKEQKKNE